MKIEDIERGILDVEALRDATTHGDKSELFRTIAAAVGETVVTKNAAYGDAFAKAGAFLKLAFPEKILPEQYEDMLGIVRVFDKLMRIATDKRALNEDPWKDVAGYGVLGVAAQKLRVAPSEPRVDKSLPIGPGEEDRGVYAGYGCFEGIQGDDAHRLVMFTRHDDGLWIAHINHCAWSLSDKEFRKRFRPFGEVAKKLFAKSP